LPNIPDNMPDSFYQMLEGAMTYRPKSRSTAGQLLQGEFAQFHIHHDENKTIPSDDDEEDVVEESADDLPPRRFIAKTKSVLLEGSVSRHSSFLGYQTFERSLTALLATILPNDQCKTLVTTLRGHNESHKIDDATKEEKTEVDDGNKKGTNASKLQVIPINELVNVIQEMNTKESSEV
jgi:hypothetical protein